MATAGPWRPGVKRVHWTILWNGKVVTKSLKVSAPSMRILCLPFGAGGKSASRSACSSTGIALWDDLIRADPVANLFFGRMRQTGKLEIFEPARPPISSSEECGSQEGSIPGTSQTTSFDPFGRSQGHTGLEETASVASIKMAFPRE
jgi:hypothetical protein